MMQSKRRMTETEVMKHSELFGMNKDEAIVEIADQLRVFRIYAQTKGMVFLDYLLRMAEMEARRETGEPVPEN